MDSVGSALAAIDGPFDWPLALLALLSAILLHAATNLINDYYDVVNGVDTVQAATAQYRPHPLVEGLLPRAHVRRVAYGLFVLAALALGPGLVVNAGFKDHWGRARPRDVTQFSGERTFTPALQPTDQCDRNCSFVAGHPSVAFWLAALGFAAASHRLRSR